MRIIVGPVWTPDMSGLPAPMRALNECVWFIIHRRNQCNRRNLRISLTHLFLPQIIIGLVQPILSRRTKDIHVERVFQRFGFVLNV